MVDFDDKNLAVRDDVQELRNATVRFRSQAEAMIITSAYDLATAIDAQRQIRLMSKQIREYWDPDIREARAVYRRIMRKRDEWLKPLSEADAILGKKVIGWQEWDQVSREAEADRIRAVLQDAPAAIASAYGDQLAAERARAIKEITRQIPIKRHQLQRTDSGTQYRQVEYHTAEVTDILALADAVATGQIDSSVILPNLHVLDAMARRHGENLDVPGVRPVKNIKTAIYKSVHRKSR